MNNIFVTGSAGFIGYHICKKLIEKKLNVIGFDNFNDYYDVKLKYARIDKLDQFSKNNKNNWRFFKGDLVDKELIEKIFSEKKIDVVINMAAQAGVRYSIENPSCYVNSNLVGFCNLLEICRKFQIKNFLYASSSSVYGGNMKYPFSEKDNVNHPVSLYAATKKANELIAHSYSNLFNLPSTGLRLFTVYGPYGRPDMAPMLFANAIVKGTPINLFNHGQMYRDFTFVEDVAEIICKLINKPATSSNEFDKKSPDPSSSWCPHRIFNIGNNNPILLLDFVKTLERELGRKAIIKNTDMQPGDVIKTSASTNLLEEWIGIQTKTSLETGIKLFINWFQDYYKI